MNAPAITYDAGLEAHVVAEQQAAAPADPCADQRWDETLAQVSRLMRHHAADKAVRLVADGAAFAVWPEAIGLWSVWITDEECRRALLGPEGAAYELKHLQLAGIPGAISELRAALAADLAATFSDAE